MGNLFLKDIIHGNETAKESARRDKDKSRLPLLNFPIRQWSSSFLESCLLLCASSSPPSSLQWTLLVCIYFFAIAAHALRAFSFICCAIHVHMRA